MAAVVVSPDGGVLQSAVHALDLAVGPGVVRPGQAVLDAGAGASELEGVGSIERLREADPPLPDAFDDRQQDNWRPLCAIADLLGGDWPRRAREAAVALAVPRAGQETKGALLLGAIREVFDHDSRQSIGSTVLVERLCELPDSPWSEWNRGKPISARGIARILAGIEISPQKGRSSSLYVRQDFEDAWSRYLPTEPP